MKLSEAITQVKDKLTQIKGESVPEILNSLNKAGKEYGFHVTSGAKGRWTAIWPKGKLLSATLPEVVRALTKLIQND